MTITEQKTRLLAVPLLLISLYFCLATFADPLSTKPPIKELVYPSAQRQDYAIILLERALEAAGQLYTLRASATQYGQKRALTDLATDKGIDVAWSMTSKEREDSLMAIRIPIFKGLIGWRLPLVRSGNADLFAGATEVENIRAFRAGQLHDWPDTKIFKDNDVPVFGSSTYEGLFKMLAKGRIDYFPRSVIEVWQELEARPELDLEVESNIVIYYPTAFYYFVSKSRPDLYHIILRGLNTMQQNGEFDQLFFQHFGELVKRAQLPSRQKIPLINPLLPYNTPLKNKHYWYRVAPPSN